LRRLLSRECGTISRRIRVPCRSGTRWRRAIVDVLILGDRHIGRWCVVSGQRLRHTVVGYSARVRARSGARLIGGLRVTGNGLLPGRRKVCGIGRDRLRDSGFDRCQRLPAGGAKSGFVSVWLSTFGAEHSVSHLLARSGSAKQWSSKAEQFLAVCYCTLCLAFTFCSNLT